MGVMKFGAAIALLAGSVAGQCPVPEGAYWGDYVVSDCGPAGTIKQVGESCIQTCAPPSDQYAGVDANGNTVTSVVTTCVRDNSGTDRWDSNGIICTPLNALLETPVWCGDSTATYINGFTYSITTVC